MKNGVLKMDKELDQLNELKQRFSDLRGWCTRTPQGSLPLAIWFFVSAVALRDRPFAR